MVRERFKRELAKAMSNSLGMLLYAAMTDQLSRVGDIVADFDPTEGIAGEVGPLEDLLEVYSGLEDGLAYIEVLLTKWKIETGTAVNIALALDTDE